MATHSRILVWEIPWAEEPGRSWGSHKESEQLSTPSLDSLIFCFLLPFILFFSYVFCGQEEANKGPSTKFSEWSTSAHKVCLHPSVPLWLISFYSPLCLLILPHQPPCCFEMYQAHSFLGLLYWLFYLPGMCFLLIYTRFTPSCLSSVCPITTSSLRQPLTILFKIPSQNKWTNIKQNRNSYRYKQKTDVYQMGGGRWGKEIGEGD